VNFLTGIFNGLREIWAHKLRSALTMVCVLLGVASLVVIVGFVEGLFQNWKVWIAESGGLEKLAIHDDQAPNSKRTREGLLQGRTLKDAEAIAALSRHARCVSPEVDLPGSRVRRKGKNFRVPTSGVTEAIFFINRYELDQGRSISHYDVTHVENVVVLGTAVVEALYAEGEEILGTTVTINGFPFTVVGVLKKYSLGDGDYNLLERKNRQALIPISTMQKKIVGRPELTWLNVQIKDISKLREAVDELDNIMTHSHGGVHDFQVQTQEETLRDLEKMQRNFILVGGGIGVITLLVGGIGIMNLMLASINERVREIGIRKALGAWNSDIFIQFLAEAVALSILGGLCGVLMGSGVIKILQTVMQNSAPPQISIMAVMVGFSFSVLMGILSGIYPAFQASRLDPIEALRYE
jgi:putative ABC transport system permease protein